MITDIVADCWDARYEEDIETLLVFCYLREMGVKRVLPLNRADFSFQGNPDVPHEEMYKTAELWKGKPFNLQIEDGDEKKEGEALFSNEKFMIGDVGNQMMDIADQMSSDEWVMKFKTDDLFGRMRCGQKDSQSA